MVSTGDGIACARCLVDRVKSLEAENAELKEDLVMFEVNDGIIARRLGAENLRLSQLLKLVWDFNKSDLDQCVRHAIRDYYDKASEAGDD